MTEIPEHLRNRTNSRRQALGLPVSGGDAAPGAAAPVVAGGGAIAPTGGGAPVAKGPVAPSGGLQAAKPAPKPVPHYVQAFNRRKRIPVWAMPAVFGLPLWGVIYAGTLAPPPTNNLTLIQEGAVVFQSCAACHGGTGGGGVGPQLSQGKVLETFSNPIDQVRWIITGSSGHVGPVYGDTKKAKKGGMPTFGGQLSLTEIVSVVRHERETLSGKKFADEATAWAELEKIPAEFPKVFKDQKVATLEVETILEELTTQTGAVVKPEATKKA